MRPPRRGCGRRAGCTLSAGTGTLQVRTVDLAGNITSGTGHSYTLDIPTVIEAFGSTSLGQVGSNYFLYPAPSRKWLIGFWKTGDEWCGTTVQYIRLCLSYVAALQFAAMIVDD